MPKKPEPVRPEPPPNVEYVAGGGTHLVAEFVTKCIFALVVMVAAIGGILYLRPPVKEFPAVVTSHVGSVVYLMIRDQRSGVTIRAEVHDNVGGTDANALDLRDGDPVMCHVERDQYVVCRPVPQVLLGDE